MNEMDKVSSLIGSILAKRGLRDHAEAAMFTHRISAWLAERHPGLRSMVKIGSVRDGIVSLECKHSIALRECQDLLPELQAFIASQPDWMGGIRVRIARDRAERVA